MCPPAAPRWPGTIFPASESLLRLSGAMRNASRGRASACTRYTRSYSSPLCVDRTGYTNLYILIKLGSYYVFLQLKNRFSHSHTDYVVYLTYYTNS